MIAPVATSTADLVRELERLPARPSAAVRVLWMVDDPNASAQDLAAAWQVYGAARACGVGAVVEL